SFAQLDFGSAAGNIGDTARDHVAFLVFGYIFVNGSRLELFHPEPDAPLLAVHIQHDCAHGLALLEDLLRMIDALLGAEIADVDHAFDAVPQIHERAELHQAGYRAFDDTANRKLLLDFGPGVAQRLFQSERNAALAHTQDHHFDRVSRL